jgi:hypothetical protein
MTRGLLVIFLKALTGTASPQNTNGAPPARFDPKPWLEDFHQILSEMSAHYANLEWAVEDRKMDLPRLRLDTEAKVREATTENDARRSLDKFIASFGDGHLEIEWPCASGLGRARFRLSTRQETAHCFGVSGGRHHEIARTPRQSSTKRPLRTMPAGFLK